MRAAIFWLDRISDFLNRIALWGAVLAVASLVLIAGWQAAARYLLDQPPAWTEELARYLMVWAGLLGASCAFRFQVDPSLFPAARERADGVGRVYAVLRALGAFIFVAPILWYSLYGLNGKIASGYIARNARVTAETLDVPMSVFAMAIPIGFGLIMLHLLANLSTALMQPKET
ncbi:TRAP transporter small permease [Ruegeria pomeroyi]|uniref:TRAP transporter small permease protein n=1 Tax=Ruegeria pomeroyi TaxID=89184 RepID=A0A9Q3WPK6_9RHOB|nr:TRAP transporter small permease [Ruegeria pomeroyi]MCE8539991.1 TRAP transporter small permease [Ruegeria pomeroyi]